MDVIDFEQQFSGQLRASFFPIFLFQISVCLHYGKTMSNTHMKTVNHTVKL